MNAYMFFYFFLFLGHTSRHGWSNTIYANIIVSFEGDDSFVLGHAAFGRDHNMGPCITGGIVSKIVYHSNSPVLIQVSPIYLLYNFKRFY